MSSRHHLRAVLARRGFRRLLTTRLSGQLGDGIFQAGLAGTILFNPDRHTSPLGIALGFAVLLLPYSLVGPFAGVVLDRWSRRHVLVLANLARAAVVPVIAVMVWFGFASGWLLPLVLIIIGINRLVLTAVTAAAPHVTDDDELVTANSLSITLGGVSYAIGIALALAARAVLGASDHSYAVIVFTALAGYLAGAAFATRFSVLALGPDHGQQHRGNPLHAAWQALGAGARHLRSRPMAAQMLLAVTVSRLGYGITMMAVILLYRNYFSDDGLFQAQEAGMGQVMLVSAAGNLLAAGVTPVGVRRFGRRTVLIAMLALAGATQFALGTRFSMPTLLAAVFLVALALQSARLTTDTALQLEAADDYRGRVFAVFDTLFNSFLVLGLLVGALALPTSGRSYVVLVGVSLGYGLLAAGLWWLSRNRPTAGYVAKRDGLVPVARGS